MARFREENGIDPAAYESAFAAVLRHRNEMRPGKVLHVETEFGAVVHYGKDKQKSKRLTARLDLVMKQAGKVYIIDHKFVYKHSADTMMRYNISGQFLMQTMMGQRIWKDRFGGILIHCLQCIPPFKDSTYPLEPAPAAMATFLPAARRALERMDLLAAENNPAAYRPAFNEQVCLSAYGPCEMYNHCQWLMK